MNPQNHDSCDMHHQSSCMNHAPVACPRAAAHAFRVSGVRAPPRMHSACQGSARRRACIPRVRDPARLRARFPRVTTECCTTFGLSPPPGTLAPRPRLSRPSWWDPPTPGEMVARGVRPHPPTSPPKPPPDTLRVPPRQTNTWRLLPSRRGGRAAMHQNGTIFQYGLRKKGKEKHPGA